MSPSEATQSRPQEQPFGVHAHTHPTDSSEEERQEGLLICVTAEVYSSMPKRSGTKDPDNVVLGG